jgi:cytochrome c oxidase subunit 2
MLPPATPDAQLIKNLYDGVYIFAVITFVLVEALLVYTAVRFRRRSPADAPVQTHGNNLAELGWTIVPAIVVAIVFFMSVDTAGRLAGHGPASAPVARVHAIGDKVAAQRIEEAAKVDLVIEVTGRQWFWQYAYKTDGALMADSNDGKPLVIPAGKTIRLDLTAADVIHAWWVPQLGPMLYVNPGERTAIFIENAQPGEYIGQCNFYCGLQHAYMLNNVKVVPEAEFEAWYKNAVAAAAGAVASK